MKLFLGFLLFLFFSFMPVVSEALTEDVTVTKSYADGVYYFDWYYHGAEPLQDVQFVAIGADGAYFSSDFDFHVDNHGDGHIIYSIPDAYDYSSSSSFGYLYDFETGAWIENTTYVPVIDANYINGMSLMSFGLDADWNAVEAGNWNTGPGGSWEGMTPAVVTSLDVTSGLSWVSSPSPFEALYASSSPLQLGTGLGAVLIGFAGAGLVFTGYKAIKKSGLKG